MQLFYYRDPAGNFGDDLNAWLWPRLAPELLDDDSSSLLVGIGSILDSRIPPTPAKLVFGTGIGYGRLPILDERWHICCVRGPLSAEALGLPAELAVTDPAVLVSTVPLPLLSEGKGTAVSFIPHFRTLTRASGEGVNLRMACQETGINYINPSGGVEQVLRDIQGSRLVIAEAMHGAIVADALGIPWIPVRLYDHILALKWWDWCKSLGLRYSPALFKPRSGVAASNDQLPRFLEQVKSGTTPLLSDRALLGRAVSRLQERLEKIKRAYRPGGDVAGTTDSGCFMPKMELDTNPEVFREVPWLYRMHMALREIASLVPPGESFILVDDQQWGGGEMLSNRHAIPFLERDGEYWGPPPDDETALLELYRLRSSGARFIVFAWPSFWWLDHYKTFLHQLRSSFVCSIESDRLLAFDLYSRQGTGLC